MPTQPPPPDESWPVPESTTLVAPPPPPPPPGAPPPEPPADRRIGWGMLFGLGVLALVALGILIAWLLTHRSHSHPATTVVVTNTAPPTTTAAARRRHSAPLKLAVPSVIGRPEATAQAALRKDGFTVHAVTVPSSMPKGLVTAQSPSAGQVQPKGSAVRINVSNGASHSGAFSPTTTAPSATTTVTTTGQASTTTAQTTTAQATTTVQTTTAKAPTTTVAPPQPTTASVPDVTGDELQAAVQKLNSAGFLASIQYIPGTDPLGTIREQSPSGGNSAKTRSHVTINASSGPGNKTPETVPNVVGRTLQDAVSGVNGAHLRLIYVKLPVTDRTQVGKIVEQTPLAGKQAPENAQILVYLGVLRP